MTKSPKGLKKGKKGSSKAFIQQKITAAKIQLVATSSLNVTLQRRQLGLEGDDKNPKTFTGNEDFIKTLVKKLAKAKAERNRTGK